MSVHLSHVSAILVQKLVDDHLYSYVHPVAISLLVLNQEPTLLYVWQIWLQIKKLSFDMFFFYFWLKIKNLNIAVKNNNSIDEIIYSS